MTIPRIKMKGKHLKPWLLLLPLLAGSCRYEDPEPLVCEVFEDLLFERKVDFDAMLSDMRHHYGETTGTFEGFEEAVKDARLIAEDFTVYGISYRTVDHQGRPVKASGLVYFPETTHIQGIIEILPVNKCRESCGTANKTVAEAMVGLGGHIMIVPDLLGCGQSDSYPIAYLQHENIARVAADMRKAAYEFLYNHRYIRLGGEDYIFGFSLGGSGALALARHYQQHPELGVKVKELWIGSGAYAPAETIDEILDRGTCGYAILPNILYALNWYENLGIDLREAFSGEMRERYEELANGDIEIDILTQRYGSSLDAYLNPAFFREDNAQWQKLHRALEDLTVPLDFKPDYPVRVFHSVDDEVIPCASSDRLVERLRQAGVDVQYRQTTGRHHHTAYEMGITMLKYLN